MQEVHVRSKMIVHAEEKRQWKEARSQKAVDQILTHEERAVISRILIPIADEYFLEGIEEFVSGLQGQDTELRLRLLHVVEPLGTLSVLSRKCLCRDGNELLDDVSTKLKRSFPYARIEKILLEGDAKKIILQEADDWSADLILLGPHTKRGKSEFFLGRVASSILCDPPCDVAVLHKREKKLA